jgi:D-glycero-alpha-D-manno-heptose 1-phosphate guanylyltransferase
MSNIAIILCGGVGSRFRSISTNPKILTEFNGVKYIDWIYSYLYNNGFETVILCLGYRAVDVLKHLEEKPPLLSTKTIIEEEALGTGGAVLNAMKKFSVDDAFVFNGDTYWSSNIPAAMFASIDVDCAMCVSLIKNNDRYGAVYQSEDRTASIVRGTANEPLYNSHVSNGIVRLKVKPQKITLPLPCSLESLVTQQKLTVSTFPMPGSFIDYGTPSGYRRLNTKNEI